MQRLGLSQAEPSSAAMVLHVCVDSSQVSTVHGGTSMPHSFCAPPSHMPAMQLSFTVQNKPSSQPSPSVPGEVSDGTYICLQNYVARKPHSFNVLGQHHLFCLSKGGGFFRVVPENEKREAVRKVTSQGGNGRR